MGADEMKQIAAMIKKALASCKPALTKDGQPSQAKYTMDETVRAQIKEEAGQMLARFRLYPELD